MFQGSQISRYRRLARRRRRLVTLLIIPVLFSAIGVGVVSYYGDHVGDFLILVEKDTVMSLSLSENREFSDPRTKLTPMGVQRQTNSSFFDLPLDEKSYPSFAEAGGNVFYSFETHPGGDCSDRIMNNYFAYTFFLKNTSRADRSVDYVITIQMGSVYKRVDEAIRIMLIRNRDVMGLDGNRWIFAKAELDEEGNRNQSQQHETNTNWDEIYYSTPFKNDKTICNIRINNLPHQQIDDYTVVMWLEGDDPDCNNTILGGKITLEMSFSIV